MRSVRMTPSIARKLMMVICAAGLLAARMPEIVNVAAPEVKTTTSPYLALVTNSADGTVSVMDIDSGTVVQTITVGAAQGGGYSPGCIAISPDESLALVTYEREGSHRVIALDVTAIADGVGDNEIIDTIYLEHTEPEGPNCLAIAPGGTTAYVAGGTNSADIAAIDIAAIADGTPDNEVTWVDTGNAFWESIAITPDSSRAYVVSDGYTDKAYVIDTDSTSPTYHTVVDYVELNSDIPISTRSSDIAITPNGDRAYVADGRVFQDKVYVIDTDPDSPTYNTVVEEIDLDPVGKQAYGIVITPDGTRAYVTRLGEVAIIDTDSTSPTYNTIIDTIPNIPTGEGGVEITSDGETLLVVSRVNNTVSIIDTSSGTKVGNVSVSQSPTGLAIYRAPVPENHVKVVDETGSPLKGALVYHNGLAVGATDERGFVVPPDMQPGDRFTAISTIYEQLSVRAGHQTSDSNQGWAYRVHITSLGQDASGNPVPHVVTEPGQQILTVHPSSPLVLFNLVVSIEWDASDDYMAAIARAAQSASDYLYDLTDGQMAFGQVTLYDNGAFWADADIQISTKNIVHPHAYVGGITAEDKSHVIRLGRGWDGDSGNQGPWDQPDGYRTLIHEFGHYALHLYDEYFAYLLDQSGNLLGEVPAYCTMPYEQLPEDDAESASAMYHQYTTSELSARDVPGLWSPLCEQTAQWQLNGESAWETVARVYTDTVSPPRWQLTTPLDRGSVLAGPTGVPTDVLALPTVTISNTGASGLPRHLTVYGPQGPYWGALVALYKQDGRVIGQGFTDGSGRLTIYGAEEGDILRAASMDGGLAGSAAVGTEMSLTLTLAPVGGLAVQAEGGRKIPHLRVIAEPSPDPSQVDLLVSLHNFGPGADPSLTVSEPGDEVGHSPPLVPYDPNTGLYQIGIRFSAAKQGMGRVRAAGAVGDSLVRLHTTYRLQRVRNAQDQDVYSDDGNLSLHLERGSLPGSEAYFVVMPPGALPGPLPAGLALVGDPYDVTASGALVTLEQPAVLKLRYDEALVSSSSAPEGLGIYRWDPNEEAWQAVAGELDEGQRALVAPVTALGTYALLAPPGPWNEPPRNFVFLPIILKGGP